MVKCPLLFDFVLSRACVDYTPLPKRIDSVFISPVSRRRDKATYTLARPHHKKTHRPDTLERCV
jgi:hypothetical protein